MYDPYATVFHKDGGVELWNVYAQSWQLFSDMPPVEILATLSEDERTKLENHDWRNQIMKGISSCPHKLKKSS